MTLAPNDHVPPEGGKICLRATLSDSDLAPPPRPGRVVGAARPTAAGRPDRYTPRFLAGAHCGRLIKSAKILAWPEPGPGPEALAALEAEDFPAAAVFDFPGDNLRGSGSGAYSGAYSGADLAQARGGAPPCPGARSF
ncbi:MAG: hypothetical protein LBP95_00565 [Deltaproteobacteria bacterium]|nr:hypothetical protein [Deltaproteobacteria bacterium]